MQHDLIRQLRRIHRIPFTPIIAHRVRKDIPALVEIRAADRAPDLRIALQAVLGVLVPEVEGAVGAGGGEGAVLGVEGDGVDGEDVADVAAVGRGLAVAFEGEVGGGVFLLNVLDRAAAFDAADCEPGGVGEAREDSRLPLQGALEGFVEVGRFVQVDDVDVAVRGADDEELVPGVDAVDALLAGDCRDGVGRP